MGKLTNGEIYVRNWTEFGVALASLIATLLQIATIFRMRAWNGYILLICSMCVFQILYDINFLLGVAPGYSACMTWNFLDVLGGLSVSFWTNCISFVIMVTVVKIKSFNVFQHYWKFCLYAIFFPFIIAILSLFVIVPAGQDDDKPFNFCAFDNSKLSDAVAGIYYWGRILAIIVNVVVFVFISCRVTNMHLKVTLQTPMSESTANGSLPSRRISRSIEQQNLAIATLVSRLKYYPIAQVLSRSGALWNGFENYRYSNFSSSMMNAVTGPSLGMMCFVIFLVMQPKARETFFEMFGCTSLITIKAPRTNSTIFRSSIHHYSEDDLDQMIDEESMHNLESIENVIHASSLSGLSRSTLRRNFPTADDVAM